MSEDEQYPPLPSVRPGVGQAPPDDHPSFNESPSRRPARIDAAWQASAIARFKKQLAGLGRFAAVTENTLGPDTPLVRPVQCRASGRLQARTRESGGQFAAHRQQRQQVFFDLPGLTFRALTVAGRVEDDGVIAIPALQLALTETCGVLGNPADGSVAREPTIRRCGGPVRRCSGPRRYELLLHRPPRPPACCLRCRRTDSAPAAAAQVLPVSVCRSAWRSNSNSRAVRETHRHAQTARVAAAT